MKNLFRFKLEVLMIIANTLATILSYSIYVDSNNDVRVKVLMFFCAALLLISIFGFNTIKEFRHDVLKRW